MPNMSNQEQDIRLRMLNSFMSCPHRDTDKIKQVHAELREKDPVFYSRLASWYNRTGELRDHQEVFAAMLITDPFLDNREVGMGLFRRHAPFMKSRILGFIKGKKVKVRTKTGKKVKVGKKSHDEVKIEAKNVGLCVNPGTAFRKDVEAYLRWLESDDTRFDGVCFRNFKDLKQMYASLQIKPCKRAQEILFKKKYPEGSKLNVFKEIADTKSPAKAAKLIVEHKVPYTVAVGLVQKVTPSVLVALINSMSPQEVINNVASLQEKGAYDNPDIKKLITDKLEKAKKSKKVSTLKSKTAKSTGRVKDEEILQQLDDVADEQVKTKGQISLATAVFVDRSGSMSKAIEVGKRVASLISGATVADLHVVAFDNVAAPIRCEGKTLSAWERAFSAIRSGGSTSMGCALDYLLRKESYVEQIVVITDEGENARPMFSEVYKRYSEKMNVTPNVVVINVDDDTGWGGADKTFSNNLTRAGIEFDTYKPAGADYYGLPGLLPLLARKSKLDLVYEIMDEPLVTRKAFR